MNIKEKPGYLLHAVNYPKSKYTYNQALSSALKDYGKFDHYRQMPNFWRFTFIKKESIKKKGYDNYKTKILNNGVELILGYPNVRT
jgi:hypothetical protein